MLCELCQRNIPDQDWATHESGKKHQKKLEFWRASHCALYIGNLQCRITEEQLQNYFASFGTIDAIKMHTHRGSAIVTYTDESAVKQALSQSHHKIGSHYIQVCRSQPYNKLAQTTSSTQNTDQKCSDLKQVWFKLNETDDIGTQMNCLLQHWSLSEQRFEDIIKFVDSLQKAIQKVIPEAHLQPFGSVVNGLGSANCDLDVVLQFVREQHNLQHPPVLLKQKHLKGLKVEDGFITYESLQQLPAAKMCRVILSILQSSSMRRYLNNFIPLTSARKPVLKFHYLCANLDVDMTFHASLSVRNTHLIKILLQLDDRVRPLVFTLRIWIKLAGFCDNQATRITNYALFLLVYFYLENTEPRILPTVESLYQLAVDHGHPRCELEGWDCTFVDDVNLIQSTLLPQANTLSLAELLRGFFDFYAKLDMLSTVICPRTGKVHSLLEFRKTVLSDEKMKPFKFRYFCLQDPFDLGHNTLTNVNQKYAHHFSRNVLQTAAIIHYNANNWNLRTILPNHPVILSDDVIPLRDSLTVVLPFIVCDLSELFWHCSTTEEAQTVWYQYTRDVLLQCLDVWKIKTETVTDHHMSNLSAEHKRKAEHHGKADMKRALLEDEKLKNKSEPAVSAEIMDAAANTTTVPSMDMSNSPDKTSTPITVSAISVDNEGISGNDSLPNSGMTATALDSPLMFFAIQTPKKGTALSQKHFLLKRIVLQTMCIHCQTTQRLWHGRKHVASSVRSQNQNLSALDVEREVTRQLLENNKSLNVPGGELTFDLCLEMVRYGHWIQIEIVVEAAKNHPEIIQFKRFMHHYGCKVLKHALECTS